MKSACTDICVSAIVSTFNSERFIRGCIEDLERQTIADRVEIIIVDSGSEERERDIVSELQKVYDNIHYIRTEERESVYAAWNRGIAAARGRYITNANTDDRHRHDAFEVMVGILDATASVDLVYADVFITQTENETFENHHRTGRYNWFPWDRNILLDRGCFIGPQPMWRRTLHDLYGGFDPAFVTSGDYEFWLRISQTAKFHYIEEPLGLYLQHPGSIEHRNEQKKNQENREILTIYREAANDGRLIRFLPFERLRECSKSPAGKVGTLLTVAGHITSLILANGSTTPSTEQYLSCRTLLLSNPDSSHLIDDFIAAAEGAILNSSSWYLERRRKPSEAKLRAHVSTEAVMEARLLFQRGLLDEAVGILINKAIAADPSSSTPYLELANLLIEAKRHEDALQVVAEMPPETDQGVVQELQAACMAARGDDAAAETLARAALSGGRHSSRALVTLGIIAARRGTVAEAEQNFRSALSCDPRCSSAWLSLGMLLWGEGKANEAFDALCQSVDSAPLGEAANLLMDMAHRLGRLHDAGEVITAVAAANPQNRMLHREVVRVQHELGRTSHVLKAAQSFLATFGPDDDVLMLGTSARCSLDVHERLKDHGSKSLSLTMIVRNEERNLARCLSSALPVVDEVVVVDTGSDDRTVEIARVFGAKVAHVQWKDDYSEARNHALALATGKWILLLDADEALSVKDHGIIAEQVNGAGGKSIAYQVITRNYTDIATSQGWLPNDGQYSREEAAGGWYPSHKVRLFPNDQRVRFSGKVHEMVEESLRRYGYEILSAGFVVHHYGELDSEAVRIKKNRYYQMGKEKLETDRDNPMLMAELAVQAGELGHLEEALHLWNEVLLRSPRNVEALFNRGGVQLLLGHYHGCRDDSAGVLEIEPTHKEAACNLATALINLGQPMEAGRIMESCSPHPDYPPAVVVNMILGIILQNPDVAVTNCNRLIKMNYAPRMILADRAATLQQAGQRDAAHQLQTWWDYYGN